MYLVQNFLFSSKDEDSQLKAIDFGLSDFVKPGWLTVLQSVRALLVAIKIWQWFLMV